MKIKLILLLLLISTVVYSQQLTNEQVIQIVKDFENNQNLSNLSVQYYNDFNHYLVTLHDTSNYKSWTVENNNVRVYINFNEINMEDTAEENLNYTQQQCQNIGINYINSKNISLVGYNTEPIIEWEYNGCYGYTFYQIIDSELKLKSKNFVRVDVNAFSGNIATITFSASSSFILINRPNLTIPQVIQIVQQNFDNISSDSIFTSDYYINDTNDSIYRQAIVGNIGMVDIDAYTHEIVGFHSYGNNQSIPKGLKIKKIKSNDNIKILREENIKDIKINNHSINFILCNTKNSKNVKYTELKKDYVIEKDDKGIARMEVNGNKFIFRNGSYWCFINNKTYNMGGNCIIENGKLKLPEEFYKKVQDKDYQFFRK